MKPLGWLAMLTGAGLVLAGPLPNARADRGSGRTSSSSSPSSSSSGDVRDSGRSGSGHDSGGRADQGGGQWHSGGGGGASSGGFTGHPGNTGSPRDPGHGGDRNGSGFGRPSTGNGSFSHPGQGGGQRNPGVGDRGGRGYGAPPASGSGSFSHPGQGGGHDFGHGGNSGSSWNSKRDGDRDHRFHGSRYGGSRAVVVYGYPYYPVPAFGASVVVADAASDYSQNAASTQYDADNQALSSWYQVGHDWAQDLRQEIVTWDQFVNYVRAYVVKATDLQFEEFRRGFIAGYGVNAEAAFDQAVRQAGG